MSDKYLHELPLTNYKVYDFNSSLIPVYLGYGFRLVSISDKQIEAYLPEGWSFKFNLDGGIARHIYSPDGEWAWVRYNQIHFIGHVEQKMYAVPAHAKIDSTVYLYDLRGKRVKTKSEITYFGLTMTHHLPQDGYVVMASHIGDGMTAEDRQYLPWLELNAIGYVVDGKFRLNERALIFKPLPPGQHDLNYHT